MNKLKLIMIILLALLIVGCSNTTINEATQQGKLALENKEYDKALSLFNIAVNEGSKDSEIKELIKIITDFNSGKNFIEERKLEEAKKVLNSMSKNYTKYSIKGDVDDLKKEITLYEENNVFVNMEIEEISRLISEFKYSDAKIKAEALLSGDREVSESKKKEIDLQIETINNELEKIEKKIQESQIPKEYVSALKKAQEYSDNEHLSKQYIYNLLTETFGGSFSPESAQYAVDNVRADWKENASIIARRFYEGLNGDISELKTELLYQLTAKAGAAFTIEEGEYAVDKLE